MRPALSRPACLAVALALLAVATLPAAAAADPEIGVVYPNPVADRDAGEFVTLSVPPDTRLGRYRLGDDDAVVDLPEVTASGRVTLSTDPDATEPLVDSPVYPLGDGLALSNAGERVVLWRNDTVRDAIEYEDAPEGSRLLAGTGEWRPLGATDRPVVTGGPATVRAFALPDAPGVALEHLRGAEDRILLAGYTLSSERVTDALLAAASRNVTVRVLVDGEPVGGMTRRQARTLDRLSDGGVEVRAVGGEYARYAFHHAKYAVADDRALVTTENWKPAGVGGASSRGWGVVTGQPRIVDGLVETFRADAGWRAARPWERVRADRSFVAGNASEGDYPASFEPSPIRVDRTRLLVAPDNAERAVLGVIDNATDSLAVQQVSVGSPGQPFLRATLEAARRGVRVRVLLSGAWYAAEQNRRLAERLNRRADREDLPLTARLADPRGRFEKVHTKGMIVDGDQVVLGSLNWNNHSARENRETVLVLEGESAGRYYGRVFDADWPTPVGVPAGLLLAVAVAALAAARIGRRLEFE